MYFNKVDTPSNFAFDSAPRPHAEDLGGSVFRLRCRDGRWARGSLSEAGLRPEAFSGEKSAASLEVGEGGEIRLSFGGKAILSSEEGRGFGVNGRKWIQCLRYEEGMRFFGMGEKNLGFERSGKRTVYWNTDAFADFSWDQIGGARYDPAYASLPVLFVRSAGLWAAIVVDNPFPVFMNTGAEEGIFQAGATPFKRELSFGSRDGEPDYYLLASDDPADLVRKVQALQGRTPLPPLWALGHQQCRWGYATISDLEKVADEYEARGIPNDGLWLDIDYMDGFRVFSIRKDQAEGISRGIASLTSRGYRVVPILDPGIRQDPDYPVYRKAKEADVLCKTPEGRDFVGYVWPGYTVFPDFSLPEGREFWKREVASFAKLGFSGFWIDMNDPSTGTVPLEDMLFRRGELEHEAWHNQYALGMAVATRGGLEEARPSERPFLISRSGFLGMAKHSALWNGDNCSNDEHLAASIPVSLNLSVSGLPFNGPDLPGFAGDADADLARAWYKLGFLFPFFRNHSVAGSRLQEPWRFGRRTEAVIADMIRSRYRLMPAFYNLFIDQEETGDSVIRPLWYHDPSDEAAAVCDQFTLGPSLMQAPLIHRKSVKRNVYLPAGRWYGLIEGKFLEGGRTVSVRQGPSSTPLYLKSGSLIPLRRGQIRKAAADLAQIDLLAVLSEGESAEYRYRFDDGLSTSYREGKRSEVLFRATLRSGRLSVEATALSSGSGELDFRVLSLSDAAVREIAVTGRAGGQSFALKPASEILRLAGSKLRVLRERP